MSKILANSQSPSPAPSSIQLSTPRNAETSEDLLPNGRGSSYATPAPELQTPIIASSSTLDIDPITVDDEPSRLTSTRKTHTRFRPFPDIEAVVARTKRRAVAKGRLTDEDDSMTQTATRCAHSSVVVLPMYSRLPSALHPALQRIIARFFTPMWMNRSRMFRMSFGVFYPTTFSKSLKRI